MPDPSLQFTTNTSAADAEVLRRRAAEIRAGVADLLGISPPAVLADEEKRRRLEREAGKVGVETAELAAVTRLLPGPVGKAFGFAVAGVEKLTTGEVRPTRGTAMNLLPKPFGLLSPQSVGLEPNFYIPAGVTPFVPSVVDRLGIGFREQRAADEEALRQRAAVEAEIRQRAADALVARQSDDTLQAFALGQFGSFSSIGARLSGFGSTSDVELRAAAQRELDRRTRAATGQFEGQPPPAAPVGIQPVAPAPPPEGTPAIVANINEIDRMFAANPPDP